MDWRARSTAIAAAGVCLFLGLAPLAAQTAATTSTANEPTTATQSANARPEPRGIIHIRIDRNYPPYEYEEDGEPKGFNVDLFRAVAEVMDIEYEITASPWTEARRALEAGEADLLIGMYRSPEREQTIDFSTPHTIIHHAIFVRAGSPIRTLDDIKTRDVIVEDGDIMHDLVKARQLGREVIKVVDMAEGLRLLASGKHDCLLAPKFMGLFLVQKYGLKNVVAVGPPIEPRRYCFAVAQGRQRLLGRVNEGLAITKATGKHREIYDKWFGVLEPRGVPFDTILKYGLAILGPLLLLLGLALVWSRALKGQVSKRTEELRFQLSERERAERALQESESRFRELFNNMSSGVAIYEAVDDGQDFVFVDLNPAGERISNIARDKAVEHRVTDVFPGIQALGLLGVLREVWRTGLPQHLPAARYRDECHDLWVDNYVCKLPSGHIVAVYDDVGERKRAEEALHVSEQRFRELFDAAPVGYHELDIEGRIVSVNRTELESLCYNEADLLGRQAWEFVVEQDEFSDSLLARLRGGTAVGGPLEWNYRRKDGTIIPMLVEDRVLRDAQGRVTGARSTLQDITEQKRSRESLAQINRMLEAKNRELETLVYVTSHDLRSPLVNVLGFSRELAGACENLAAVLIHADLEPGERERCRALVEQDIPEALKFIQAGAQKMEALLNGLLRLSRLGRVALSIEPLDMNAMLDSVARSMEYQLKEAGARLEIHDLPPCMGDAVQINQVFSNLLDNALKYRDPGRDCLIRVTGSRTGGRAVYRVQDNGVGIAREHLQRAFEIFCRLNPGMGSGEGLGLTAAQRIMERHDGEISVESVLGRGSVFTVVLSDVPEMGFVEVSCHGANS